MDAAWQDVRYALRLVTKNPGFSLVVILTLALGIGANAALFSIVHAVLLQPLPYHDANRLVDITTQSPEQQLFRFPASEPEFLELEKENKSFSGVAGYATLSANITGNNAPERLELAYATAPK